MATETSTETPRDKFAQFESVPLRTRIAENPRPFLKWAGVAFVLLAVELGTYGKLTAATIEGLILGLTAFLDILVSPVSATAEAWVLEIQSAGVGFLQMIGDWFASLPTLFSHETIPNQGYRTGPDGPWEGTFLGLSPAQAWAVRFVGLVGYSLFFFYWLFRGWLVYRENYRQADWTPSDDIVDRLRTHYWGLFGVLVVCLYLTMAIFGSALAPTTVEQNIQNSYQHETKFFNEESGEVETAFVGDANFNSKSKGTAEQNVGIMSYDDYDRFHPFGTLVSGRDLFTFMMGGARISLIVAGIAIGGAALAAGIFSMVSAYYGGRIDLTVLTVSDGIQSVPQLLLLIMISAVFANHWLGNILDGGFLLAVVFAFTTWPFLWRAVRGPALQVAQEEWIMAAKSFGQRPRTIMRKHMLPYVLGYLLVYASMSVGGIIIGLAALSFLGNGLGISPPTPAWGRAINLGQDYVGTKSWHISLIPGLMIVLLVTGLNALGDGIRDAIDPESMGGETEEAAAGGGA
jgi:peptide/nickel transport system permease protein